MPLPGQDPLRPDTLIPALAAAAEKANPAQPLRNQDGESNVIAATINQIDQAVPDRNAAPGDVGG